MNYLRNIHILPPNEAICTITIGKYRFLHNLQYNTVSALIVDVTPVTEGLICAYRICQAARCGNDLAPSCHPPSGRTPPLDEYILPRVFNIVNEFYDITLCIAEIAVDIARAGACLAD